MVLATDDRGLPLFTYGTLRAPEVQRELFDRELAGRRARLPGYALFEDGGYWFVAPAEGRCVEGELLVLDDEAYRRADAWEAVPFYVRVRVTVLDEDDRSVDAWVYTRPGVVGAPALEGTYASRPLDEVIAAVRLVARQWRGG